MSRHHRPLGALASAIAAGLILSVGLVTPAVADDYPSWDDVLAAQQNEQATRDQIAEIEGILQKLEAEAAELGKVASARAEELNAANVALQAATDRADRLEQSATAAQKRADESSQRAGQLIAQLARTGGGNMTIALLFSSNADDLLGSLGTASKLSEQAAALYDQAILDRNRAQSLTAQARVAEVERGEAADAAKSAYTKAQAASDEVTARLNEQQAASDQLYEQLAVLKGTTADVEARYLEGLTAEQENQPQPPPPSPGNPAPNPPPPPPSSSAVDGALAFAYAQVGKPYLFAGSGPDAWDCSGLTRAAYGAVGVYIGAHLVSSQYYTMANQGRLVPIGQMVAGDLIFYADGGVPGDFYHVAIYVGGGMMIEAPRAGVPVRVTPVRYYDALAYAGRPTP